jgi:hypothetical protein
MPIVHQTFRAPTRQPLKHAPNLLPCLHLHKPSSHEHPFYVNPLIRRFLYSTTTEAQRNN